MVSLPRDCRPVHGEGGNAGSYFFVRYYVDDGILVELQWWPDVGLASKYVRRRSAKGKRKPVKSVGPNVPH